MLRKKACCRVGPARSAICAVPMFEDSANTIGAGRLEPWLEKSLIV